MPRQVKWWMHEKNREGNSDFIIFIVRSCCKLRVDLVGFMSAPNAKQKQWLSDIAEWANESGVFWAMYAGVNSSQFELHHVLGRSAKHNKVAIGHWFVIPVPFELHNVMSNHPDNVTHFKHRFTDRFGEQRYLFNAMLGAMVFSGYDLPPDDVITAIMDTKA